MANLLESSQTQATTAPSFYNQYLSNLATTGSQAAGLGQPVKTAEYVGAQPLQEQAFQQVAGAGSSYVPQLTQASQTLGQAAGAMSPLAAGAQYLNQAADYNPAEMASQFMSPYARTAAQGLSDIAERNIQQNVSPNATAAAVGSGQYGSMRGAQVLGQLQANERQNVNSQIAQMMNQGYGQALQAATAENALLGQLGSTAGQQAAQGQQNLGAIGQQMGALAGTQQNLGLGAVNALSTLGEQQRQIQQQEELFPLTRLAQLSNIMQGYQIPTTTETKLNMSPLSAVGNIASLGGGLTQNKGVDPKTGLPISGTSLLDQLLGTGAYKKLTTSESSPTSISGGVDIGGLPDPNNPGIDLSANQTGTNQPAEGSDIYPDYSSVGLFDDREEE
jgi:hypothetical protein